MVIQTIKKSEAGDGYIVRLREVAGKNTQATLSYPAGKFGGGWLCNVMEDRKSSLELSAGNAAVAVPANGLTTVLLGE